MFAFSVIIYICFQTIQRYMYIYFNIFNICKILFICLYVYICLYNLNLIFLENIVCEKKRLYI